MSALPLRAADDCRYDAVALGEVMLRLDPGAGRIRTARRFTAWEGGGEYNVARGLRKCFGLRTAVVTALADNEIGRLIDDLICQGGVDSSRVCWLPYDGVGRSVRNGLNFTERGFGVRGAVGVSDRGHSAASQLQPADVDWGALFGGDGVRWLHTGGIFAALSEDSARVAETAMRAAKEHGTVVSYDLNYRPSLWKAVGGPARAQAVNRRLAPYVDVMLGNEEDFTQALGFTVPAADPADAAGADATEPSADPALFERMIAQVTRELTRLSVVATTLRTVHTATVNDWGALAWSDDGFVRAAHRPALEVYDRVGGGDSFAAGLIYALLDGRSLAEAVEWGAAHGALAMTTPGDTSMVSRDDVERLVGHGSARIAR